MKIVFVETSSSPMGIRMNSWSEYRGLRGTKIYNLVTQDSKSAHPLIVRNRAKSYGISTPGGNHGAKFKD